MYLPTGIVAVCVIESYLIVKSAAFILQTRAT